MLGGGGGEGERGGGGGGGGGRTENLLVFLSRINFLSGWLGAGGRVGGSAVVLLGDEMVRDGQ